MSIYEFKFHISDCFPQTQHTSNNHIVSLCRLCYLVPKGIFVFAKLVLVSGNCPVVDQNFFETETGSPFCLTETVGTIETESGSFYPRVLSPQVVFTLVLRVGRLTLIR